MAKRAGETGDIGVEERERIANDDHTSHEQRKRADRRVGWTFAVVFSLVAWATIWLLVF